MPLVTVTLIRHGESTDNLKPVPVWAGWKDAPLSNHGMNQAKAAGESLSDTCFTTIYASPLIRALTTAKVIHDFQPEPKPPLTTSLLLRERHCGIAEGHEWNMKRVHGLSDQEHYDRKIFPLLTTRGDKFPEGESLDDLAERAGEAIDELLLPVVIQALKEGKSGIHVALVSHGLCMSELVAALVRRDSDVRRKGIEVFSNSYAGMLNTAWTRISIDASVAKENLPSEFSENEVPLLKICVTDVNQHDHLTAIVRNTVQPYLYPSPFPPVRNVKLKVPLTTPIKAIPEHFLEELLKDEVKAPLAME